MKVPNVPMVPRVPNVLVLAALLTIAASASAQTTPGPADVSTPSPLIVEKIENGWLFAPDVRFTDLDGRTGTLAGGYIGRITDRTLTFGGGGYWLTNRDDNFKMAYGGAVVQWMAHADRTIGFGLRALVGGGSATMPRALGDLVAPSLGDLVNVEALNHHRSRDLRFGGRPITSFDPTQQVAVNDDFFVVEPQVDVLWNLSPRYRINFGVGYRAVAWAPYLGDQLRGVSGSIAFQVGGGSQP
jgi:hypothetical protein